MAAHDDPSPRASTFNTAFEKLLLDLRRRGVLALKQGAVFGTLSLAALATG